MTSRAGAAGAGWCKTECTRQVIDNVNEIASCCAVAAIFRRVVPAANFKFDRRHPILN